MELAGKVCVITGAARGIGAALARRFADEKVAGLVLADRLGDEVRATAASVGGVGFEGDFSRQDVLAKLVEETVGRFGRIDLFCANAGILAAGGAEASDDEWLRAWEINVMAHVRAARVVLPVMKRQGSGYWLSTASAAGLLTSLDAAPYAVTKHGAVALAEWLSIQHAADGLKVSCLCPQGVWTPMLEVSDAPSALMLKTSAVTPEAVADAVVAGIAAERFLILPHPEVADYFRNKANDYERWLAGMRKLHARTRPSPRP